MIIIANKKHLLYLGRLHPKKGVDNLLNAIIRLKYSKNNQLSLWHVDLLAGEMMAIYGY